MVLTVGCQSSSCGGDSGSQDQNDAASPRVCSAGTPNGTIKGLDGAGRITVTAAEAWPGRVEVEPPLSAEEIAGACAMINACKLADDGSALGDDALAVLTQDCAKGVGPANQKEEREIPQAGLNERFVFEARKVLAAKAGDCASIRAQETARPSEILCQEDGCWWESPVPAPPAVCKPIPKVTCAGNVATITSGDWTFTRDCSRALVACNAESSTGCSDRGPIACDKDAKDACDGNVKLGCDSEGRVSFHDCARYPGGTCVVDPGGAHCELKQKACDSVTVGCADASKLDLCVAGAKLTVDCTTLGMSGCSKGHCVPK